MEQSPVVTLPDIPVMFVAGARGRPVAEQAPLAFRQLGTALESIKQRKFYGVLLGDEYRACVAIDARDNVDALPYPRWTVPGGRFARTRIPDWEANLHRIGPAFGALRARGDVDPSRPAIEHYRNRRELLILVPVR